MLNIVTRRKKSLISPVGNTGHQMYAFFEASSLLGNLPNKNWQDTPQQENGYDCGVFTCQFLQALSQGQDYFIFTQKDMPYLRRRMIWEIGNARLRDD